MKKLGKKGTTGVIAGTITAVAVSITALLSQYNINYDTTLKYVYEVNKTSEYTATMKVEPDILQDEKSNYIILDTATLVLNKEPLTSSMVNSDNSIKFTSIPLVFTDFNNLYIEGYLSGEVVALGKFEEGGCVWYYNSKVMDEAKRKYIKSNPSTEKVEEKEK